MLVLSRRLNEKLLFPDVPATVHILGLQRGVVRLGIEAPTSVRVLRAELPDRVQEWGAEQPKSEAAESHGRQTPVPLFVRQRLQVTLKGLEMLRQRLQSAALDDAQLILDRIEEDVRMLQQRLEATDDPIGPTPKPRRSKALLVEDNANERELLATFLRRAGMDVDTANDGQDALEYLQGQGRPDLVLLDMGLPRCDGPTMVRQLRNDPAYESLKIFAVTGYRPSELDVMTGPRGVNRWFQKPVDPARLVQDLYQELQTSPRH